MSKFKKKGVKMTRKLYRLQDKLTVANAGWLSKGWFLYWVTLTSGLVPKGTLSQSWCLLLWRVCRFVGFRPEYVRIDTMEGNGVIHAVWASKKPLPLMKDWLHSNWEDIHGAWNTSISAIGKDKRHRGMDAVKVGTYMVQQYCVGQEKDGVSAIKNVRFSRSAVLGISPSRFLDAVEKFIRVHLYPVGGGGREFYRTVSECAFALASGLLYSREDGLVVECLDTASCDFVIRALPHFEGVSDDERFVFGK